VEVYSLLNQLHLNKRSLDITKKFAAIIIVVVVIIIPAIQGGGW
jgi:hypothetical protein